MVIIGVNDIYSICCLDQFKTGKTIFLYMTA